MANLLSWLGNGVKRLENTLNNDIVKPVKRDVIQPIQHVVAPVVNRAQAAVAQVNPVDSGRTYNTVRQQGPKFVPHINTSGMHQLTHNGATNLAGSFVKPLLATPLEVGNQLYNRAVAPTFNLPHQTVQQSFGKGITRFTGANNSLGKTLGDTAQTALTIGTAGLAPAVERTLGAGAARLGVKVLPRVISKPLTGAITGGVVGGPYNEASAVSAGQPITKKNVFHNLKTGTEFGSALGFGGEVAGIAAPVVAKATGKVLTKTAETLPKVNNATVAQAAKLDKQWRTLDKRANDAISRHSNAPSAVERKSAQQEAKSLIQQRNARLKEISDKLNNVPVGLSTKDVSTNASEASPELSPRQPGTSNNRPGASPSNKSLPVNKPNVPQPDVKTKLADGFMNIDTADKNAVKGVFKGAGYKNVDGFMVHPNVDEQYVKDLSPQTKQHMHDEGIVYIDHTDQAAGMAARKNLGNNVVKGVSVHSDAKIGSKLFTNKDAVITHETGHQKWQDLSPQEKAQWEAKAANSGSDYIARLQSGAAHSAASLGEEAFAENHALQQTGKYAGSSAPSKPNVPEVPKGEVYFRGEGKNAEVAAQKTLKGNQFGDGVYMTPNKEWAGKYGDVGQYRVKPGTKFYSAVREVSHEGVGTLYDKKTGVPVEFGHLPGIGKYLDKYGSGEENQALQEWARANGYHGLKIHDESKGGKLNEVVVFDKSRIEPVTQPTQGAKNLKEVQQTKQAIPAPSKSKILQRYSPDAVSKNNGVQFPINDGNRPSANNTPLLANREQKLLPPGTLRLSPAQAKNRFSALNKRGQAFDVANPQHGERTFTVTPQGKIQEGLNANTIRVAERGSKSGVPVKTRPYAKPNFDFSKWRDYSALGLGRETLERNLDRVAGKDAPAVKKFLVDSSRQNETARINFLNNERKVTRNLIVDGLGIRAGSKESALVQKYGEGLIDNGDLVKEVGTKAGDIIRASKFFRNQYDQLLSDWNSVRAKYGYEPVPARKDYFRHFQEISDASSILGVIKNARDLPTSISGITDIFSPSKPFSNAELRRRGDKTTYDAVGGFDNYLDSVSRQIFHTDTVQKGRLIEQQIRSAAEADPSLELPNFVANLHEWTNTISGKKTRIDRAAEALVGRKVYAATNYLRKKTGANMIGANVGSALSNFIPFTQSLATTSKGSFVKGMLETATSAPFSKDFTVIDGIKSPFLTRRYPTEAIDFTKLQKASKGASLPFRAVDSFTSRSIVSAKYYEGRSNGLSKAEAMKVADDYASKVITDRSAGQLPQLIETKTAGFLTQFQAEVNNQVSFLIRDIPEFAGHNKAKIASAVTQFFLYSYLFNQGYQQVTGRRSQLDPIDFAKNAADKNKSWAQKGEAFKQDILGGLPFSSIFTNGRLPVNQMAPDVKSLGSGVNDLVHGDVNKGGREIYKGVSGPVFYLAPPFGGGQVKKTIEAANTIAKGYSETPSGNIRFPEQNASAFDKGKSLLFGQYTTKPGQKYVKDVPQPLGPTQSANFKALPKDQRQGYFDSIIKQRENPAPQPTSKQTSDINSYVDSRKNKYLNKLFDTPEYQNADQNGKTKLVNGVMSDIRKAANIQTLNQGDKGASKNVKSILSDSNYNYKSKASGKSTKSSTLPKATETVFDPKTNSYTQTNKTTGKVTVINADGSRTVTKKGLGSIKNARPDYVTAIHQSSSKHGLDTPALLAVAAAEGLGGGVGDNGTSYGPFQLHVGGALPAGKDQKWAESPEGIDYAIQQISKVAKGKSGADAIAAIVNSFERPADPQGEIARALAIYNGTGATLASGSPKSAKIAGSKSTGSARKTGTARKQSLAKLTSALRTANAAVKPPKKPASPNISVKVAGTPSGYKKTPLKRYAVSKPRVSKTA